ncbi:ORC1-type DNA replication protein 1 [uncultured archaeon]|nr:ORC1-type DNA replication protein 1 [uncultured archaeon]
MAKIFSSSLGGSLFKDERFLYQEFVPERLPFRDEEISELVFCLKPASEGKRPTNVFVFGKPGTGKTVSLKFVLSELEEFSDRAKCLYINCFEYSSKQSIISKITNFLGYAVPSRGISYAELFSKFVAVLRTKKVLPVIVFDEAEQLLKSEETKSLLYDLARLPEQQKLSIGLAFISNDNFFLSQIDDRIRSSLQCSSIPFESYSPSELKEILRERAKYAFNEFALDEDVVPLCAAHAAKLGGDARIAIDVLLKAGRLASREGAKKVLVKHVRASFTQEKPVKVEVTSNLSEQERSILDLLKKKKSQDSGAIYDTLKDKFAERTLRAALAELEEKKLIVSEKEIKGRGFTRIVKLAGS